MKEEEKDWCEDVKTYMRGKKKNQEMIDGKWGGEKLIFHKKDRKSN